MLKSLSEEDTEKDILILRKTQRGDTERHHTEKDTHRDSGDTERHYTERDRGQICLKNKK